MTKEEWEHWREMPNIPTDIFFSFYKEMGGIIDDVGEFTNIFNIMLGSGRIVFGKNGVPKEVTTDSAFRKIKEYYDNKFGINE